MIFQGVFKSPTILTNSQLLSYNASYKSNANLAWPQSSVREPQCLEHSKLVFLEIQNVTVRSVLANPITYMHSMDIIIGNTIQSDLLGIKL